MNAIMKKILAISLIFLILNLYLPGITCAAQRRLYAAQNTTRITEHSPEVLSTPEEVIPIETITEEKKEGKKTWVWALAGVLLGALALSGGGGGGGEESPPSSSGNTGDVSVSW